MYIQLITSIAKAATGTMLCFLTTAYKKNKGCGVKSYIKHDEILRMLQQPLWQISLHKKPRKNIVAQKQKERLQLAKQQTMV